MKALLLARVSSKEQEEGQSIPAQERRLREYNVKFMDFLAFFGL
jgi:DNA invertase Pin-like site-specific DNA recombinase